MNYLECKAFYSYYLSIEKDCFKTEPYAAFHENNFSAFSIEYAKLLLSICCEVETVLKKICYEIQSDEKYENMAQYRKCVMKYFCKFTSESVLYRNMNYRISPWLDWKEAKAPKWWKDYTDIKHKRADLDEHGQLNFYKAKQENVLQALAALYLSEQHLLVVWERNNRKIGYQSHVLEEFKSETLIIYNWMPCYEEFMGNAYVNLTKLYEITGLSDDINQ